MSTIETRAIRGDLLRAIRGQLARLDGAQAPVFSPRDRLAVLTSQFLTITRDVESGSEPPEHALTLLAAHALAWAETLRREA